MSQTGKVKWFDDEKGFGFISPDSGGDDVFVHYTAMPRTGRARRTLAEGDRVRFVTVPGRNNKPAAADVQVLDGDGEPILA